MFRRGDHFLMVLSAFQACDLDLAAIPATCKYAISHLYGLVFAVHIQRYAASNTENAIPRQDPNPLDIFRRHLLQIRPVDRRRLRLDDAGQCLAPRGTYMPLHLSHHFLPSFLVNVLETAPCETIQVSNHHTIFLTLCQKRKTKLKQSKNSVTSLVYACCEPSFRNSFRNGAISASVSSLNARRGR